MTTPWKTWMRERLPSTTRTWTLTESPGRKSGMSLRNESASSASRVFMSAVLSPSSGYFSADSGVTGRPNRWLRPRGGATVDQRRRPAAALYCATSSGEEARRPRSRPPDQPGKQLGKLRGDERLVGVSDLLDAPPPVRLVLVGLEFGLAADVDLVDDVPESEVGLPVVHGNAEQRRDDAAQPDRPLQGGGVHVETDLLGQLAR